ncbi:MAG: hypothetical protein ACLFWM_00040 [Actinomycetota bacterium]
MPMDYDDQNQAKASFSAVYNAPTPHAYLEEMCRVGYQIGERARPHCMAGMELLKEQNGAAWPVQMLDIGCSYGLGSAFVKFGCSFEELAAFFHSRAPKEYEACTAATRHWLHAVPPLDMRVVGVDVAEKAVTFALDAGLLDGGIWTDFESPGAEATEEERAWFRSCNLVISTGAIGYVTERTMRSVLPEVGLDHPGVDGPYAVFTILRMFDPDPIAVACQESGWTMAPIEGARLPQRAFRDEQEQDRVVRQLEERGLDTHRWERRGVLYADLYGAATDEASLAKLVERLQAVDDDLEGERPLFASHVQVATAESASTGPPS